MGTYLHFIYIGAFLAGGSVLLAVGGFVIARAGKGGGGIMVPLVRRNCTLCSVRSLC